MVLRPVVLIFSCQADRINGRNEAARETWIAEWGKQVDHFFFIGNQLNIVGRDDEVIGHVPDDYAHLAWKQKKAYKWALAKGYSHAFVAYTDTYIIVPRLLQSDFEQHDYYGRQDCEGRCFAGGGMGYWLSRAAMELLAPLEPAPHIYSDEDDGYKLARLGIHVVNDNRFGGDIFTDGISAHLSKSTGVYDPETMRDLHRSFLCSVP